MSKRDLSFSENSNSKREDVTGEQKHGIIPHNFSFTEAGSYEMTNQHVKQNGKLEDNPTTGSPPRTTLLGTIFSPVFNFFSPANKNGTSGSDSPGQAVEAEEIVKQLDMEQVDEITTSTATSTNGAAYTSQAGQVRAPVNNGLEEAEETNDRDLPPLTDPVNDVRTMILSWTVSVGVASSGGGNAESTQRDAGLN
ncbi:ctd small phosphatase-like protein 2 [Limosa lapponica baueri]|uniref:Ctd small phosphatase-like protein 2 n=1 Tax=Limosa lapponica baueri TaxID=1758121 RepID=A0A2I0T4W6_LIMLA|nr:ctd small phosphatase-like protein 2 [Limosa lapponica baueri]